MTDVGLISLVLVAGAVPFFLHRLFAARERWSGRDALVASAPLFVLLSIAARGPNHEEWRYGLSLLFLACALAALILRMRTGKSA